MVIDKNNLYELEILKQVEESPHLNNRMVASKLGCSVKLAHGLLKKMVQKGFFDIKKLNTRHWNYYLTPKGISEKGKLTYEFLEFSMQFYREARKRSSQTCKNIASDAKKTVAFIGTGELAEITYLGVKEWGLELTEIYSNCEEDNFLGIPIRRYSDIKTSKADALIVCIYDKINPMTKKYLPSDLSNYLSTTNQSQSLYWIF